jgi:phage antirepressor YoqD-like protein
MNDLTLSGQKTMTVREVAAVLGVSTETVRANGKALFPELFTNGVTTYLSEAQVTAIKLKIQGHHNLQGTLEVQKIHTQLEKALIIQQALQLQQDMIADLEAQNAAMLPKAAFYDQVADAKEAYEMREVAGLLNVPNLGRNKLFDILREKKIFSPNDNLPYREYQDRGYFRVVEKAWFDKQDQAHTVPVVLTTQKGLEFIQRLVTGIVQFPPSVQTA